MALLRSGCEVTVAYPFSDRPRPDAQAEEKAEIARLAGAGVALANIQYNPIPPQSAAQVVQAVLTRLRAAGAEPVC